MSTSAPLAATRRHTARASVGGLPRRPSSRAWALLAVGLCLTGMAATWTLAALVPAAHLRDALLLEEFTRLGRPRVDRFANDLLRLLDPLLYTLWALLLVAVALLRRRPRVAFALVVVLPGAPGLAELLKPLLAHPHASAGWQWVGAASWPSGHATAAMTLVLCALVVAPRWLRPLLAALGSLFVVAVGGALLILAWHMPSDVLGGYLLGALCVSLAIAVLGEHWDGGPSASVRRSGRRRAPVRAGVP
jgi:membrane-associated phospholipid phosphatase